MVKISFYLVQCLWRISDCYDLLTYHHHFLHPNEFKLQSDVHQDGFKPQSVNQKLYSILISSQALYLLISWEIAWMNTLVPQGTEKDSVVSFSELRYWWENIVSMYTATHTMAWEVKLQQQHDWVYGREKHAIFQSKGPQNFHLPYFSSLTFVTP